MEISSITWLSEMGMEDPTFIHQCEMSFLTTKQIADSFGEEFQHSFTSTDSFFSYPPSFNQRSNKTTNTNFRCLSMEAFQPTSHEKPTKILETESSSTPSILYFENPTNPQKFYENIAGAVKPKEKVVSHGSTTFGTSCENNQNNRGNKTASTLATKSPSSAQDHIIAERKRRERHTQMFMALSAIVPGLKKMDKVSVLEDAITYMKQLQERVKTLEEQITKKTMESEINVKKLQLSPDDDTSSSDKNFSDKYHEILPDMEVRVSDKNVLIRIHCEKHQGILLKIHAEIEKFHLTVVNSRAMEFGNSALDITLVAQMDVEFCMTIKDLVKNLQSALRPFM